MKALCGDLPAHTPTLWSKLRADLKAKYGADLPNSLGGESPLATLSSSDEDEDDDSDSAGSETYGRDMATREVYDSTQDFPKDSMVDMHPLLLNGIGKLTCPVVRLPSEGAAGYCLVDVHALGFGFAEAAGK